MKRLVEEIISIFENIKVNYCKEQSQYLELALMSIRPLEDKLCKYIMSIFLEENDTVTLQQTIEYKSKKDKALVKSLNTLKNEKNPDILILERIQGVKLILDTKYIVFEKLKQHFKDFQTYEETFPYFNYMICIYEFTSFHIHAKDDYLDSNIKIEFCIETFKNLFICLAKFDSRFFKLSQIINVEFPDVKKSKKNHFTEFLTLYPALLNGFGFQSNKSYNILILPPSFHPNIISKYLKILLSIHWDIIIDFSFEETSVLLKNDIDFKNKINIFDCNKDDEDKFHPLEAKPKINWIFSNGLTNYNRKWKLYNFKIVKKLLSSFIKREEGNYTILNLYPEEEACDIIKSLLDDFISETQNPFKIINICSTHKELATLNKIKEDYEMGNNLENFIIPINEFLRFLILTDFIGLGQDNDEQLGLSLYDFRIKDEDEKEYNANGIFFYHSLPKESSQEEILQFYKGGNITRAIIEGQHDVPRNRYLNNLESLVKAQLKKNTVSFVTIQHSSGMGGSTLGWQLMHRLYNSSISSNNKDYIIGYIRDFKNGTVSMIEKLSETIQNDKIILLVDHSSVKSWEQFEKSIKNLTEQHKNILFILIQRKNNKYQFSKDNDIVEIEDYLRTKEKETFLLKYQTCTNPSREEKENLINLKHKEKVELIEFPIALDGTNLKLIKDYTKSYFEQIKNLDPRLAEFIVFSSLLYVYSGHPISCIQFGISNEELKKDIISKLMVQTIDEQNPENETTLWRPRNIKFAEAILYNYSVSIETIVMDLLDSLSKKAIIGEVTYDILNSLFINRQINSDKKEKFTLLIRSLGKQSVDSGDRVFDKLIKSFPEEPHFIAQYGRYLFETAYDDLFLEVDDERFVTGEKLLKQALNLAPKDYSILHMLGVYFRRRLNRYIKFNKKYSKEQVYEQDILKIGEEGRKFLNDSWENSKNDPFPIADLGNLCCEMIKEITEITNKDIVELEKDLEYTDFIKDLDEAIEGLEQYLNNNDKNTYRVKETFKIYNDILSKVDIFYGDKEKAQARYRELMLKHGLSTSDKIRYSKKWINLSLLIAREGLTSVFGEKNITNYEAIKNLRVNELNEILTAIESNKRDGDLASYRLFFTIMRLNPYKRNYTVDDAIRDLTEWKILAENKGEWQDIADASYFLGVCYSIKILESTTHNKLLIDFSKLYFKESKQIVIDHKISSINTKNYLLSYSDSQYTLSFSRIGNKENRSEPRQWVKGKLTRIKPQGQITTFPTGLDISFGSNKSDKSKLNKQIIYGFIGFRYEGPGLYSHFEEGSCLTDEELFYLNKAELKSYQQIQSEFEDKEIKHIIDSTVIEQDNLLLKNERRLYPEVTDTFITTSDVVSDYKPENENKIFDLKDLEKNNPPIVNTNNHPFRKDFKDISNNKSNQTAKEKVEYEGSIFESDPYSIKPVSELYFPWNSNKTHKPAFAQKFPIEIKERKDIKSHLFNSNNFRHEDKNFEVFIKVKFQVKLNLETKQAFAINIVPIQVED